MRRMARGLILRVAVAAAILAAAAAAVALPGSDRARSPQPLLARATAPLAHSNTADGRAVLTAANLKPGDERTGQVTIGNEGHEGVLYLVARPPVDTPAASGRRLSERLTMTIAEGAGDGSRVLSEGPLATAPGCHPLGRFAAGEARTYRFTVAFPDGGRGGADNAYAGASARVDYEWLESAGARDDCPHASDDVVELPESPPERSPGDIAVGDMLIAIDRGPYRFSSRTGTARIGIRCIRSSTGACRGRIELERRRAGEGRGIALAVGTFAVRASDRGRIVLRLNARARRRITSTGLVAVRAYVTARDARGRRHRVAYRDKLLYGTAGGKRRR
jgi:hypothetical protein